MKSFLQFIIPIGLIVGGGLIMMYYISPRERDYKLYISCNNNRSGYIAVGSKRINFMEGHNDCNLEIEITYVGENFVRINTPFLLHSNVYGQINEEPQQIAFVEVGETVVLYSLDRATSFTFQYQ